jgi:hypothetical protein
MNPTLVSPSQARRPAKRSTPSPQYWPGTPLTFLLAGFAWLAASYVLGVALIIGLVYGTSLPTWLKTIHVHGALAGGIVQLAIGGLLLTLLTSSERRETAVNSRPALFIAINAGTALLLISLSLEQLTVAGIAGLVLIGALLSLFNPAWNRFAAAGSIPRNAGWLYRIASAALLAGLATGTAMAFRLTDGYYAHARLAHIHFIVLGFATLTLLVAVHQLMPLLLRTPLPIGALGRLALWIVPAGFAVLLGAFLTSALWLQIAVGCLLLASITLCSSHLVVTWLKAGSHGSAASDHVLIGLFFLLLTTATGLVMAGNYLTNPPFLPIGSLHLMAYTHLAFIGFFTQVTCGCLSYFVPDLLAADRVQNTARRDVYRAQLDAIMDRWRGVQLAGMSLGTMALCLLASLTWSIPLASAYVQGAAWIASGLLVISLTLFAAKLAWAVGLRPS